MNSTDSNTAGRHQDIVHGLSAVHDDREGLQHPDVEPKRRAQFGARAAHDRRRACRRARARAPQVRHLRVSRVRRHRPAHVQVEPARPASETRPKDAPQRRPERRGSREIGKIWHN